MVKTVRSMYYPMGSEEELLLFQSKMAALVSGLPKHLIFFQYFCM